MVLSGDVKQWNAIASIPSTIPDGTYNVEFVATTPSGKTETKNVNIIIQDVSVQDFTVTYIYDNNWREYYFDLNDKYYVNGELDGYRKRDTALTEIKTTQMPINIGLIYEIKKINGQDVIQEGVPYKAQSIKAGVKVKGYIKANGSPSSIRMKVSYLLNGKSTRDYGWITFTPKDTETWEYEYTIPLDVQQKSYIRAEEIEVIKNGKTYGNEIWKDTWNSQNSSKNLFYVVGSVLDSLRYNEY